MTDDPTLREKVIESYDVDESKLQHGAIINVKVINSYAPYYYDEFTCEQPDGTVPPTRGSALPTVEDTIEFLGQFSELKDGAIKYAPEIAICMELNDEEELFYFTSRLGAMRSWTPLKSIVQLIHQQLGVTNISEDNCLPIIYDQSSVYAEGDEGILKMGRRLHEGEPEEYTFNHQDNPTEYSEDCSQLASYIDYLRNAHQNPTEWVEVEIESVLLPQPDELPILVNTPLGQSRFTFSSGEYLTMSPEEMVEELDIEKPSQLSNKTVYLRPRYNKFHDDITSFRNNICEYTATSDEHELWELSVVDPNAPSETSIGQKSIHSAQMSLENSFLEKAVRKVLRKFSWLS